MELTLFEKTVSTKLAEELGKDWIESDEFEDVKASALSFKNYGVCDVCSKIKANNELLCQIEKEVKDESYKRKLKKVINEKSIDLEKYLVYILTEKKVVIIDNKFGRVVFDPHGHLVEVCGLRNEHFDEIPY